MGRFWGFAYFICIEILIYCGYVNFLFDPQMGKGKGMGKGGVDITQGRLDDRDFRCINILCG